MRGIVVLGMHRSGTSAVTRVLNLLGAAVPSEADLLTDWDNPEGHWESRALVASNDRILGLSGRSWDFPPHLQAGWERSAGPSAMVAELGETFAATFPHEPWVWKDPRTCLTFPLWRRVLDDQGIVVVMVVRSATDVCRSIHRRDGIPRLYAAGLWLRYLSASLQGARGLPTVCVRFEDFQRAPRQATESLSAALASLGVDLPGDPGAAAASVHGGSAPVEPPRGLDRLVVRLTEQASALSERLPGLSAVFEPPPLATPGWVRPLQFSYRAQWALRSRLGRPLGPAAPQPGVSYPPTTSSSGAAPKDGAAGSGTRSGSDSKRAGRTRP